MSSGDTVYRSNPLGKGKVKLKYTFVVEVDKENYFEGENPLDIETENLKDGVMSYDELFEGAISKEVELDG